MKTKPRTWPRITDPDMAPECPADLERILDHRGHPWKRMSDDHTRWVYRYPPARSGPFVHRTWPDLLVYRGPVTEVITPPDLTSASPAQLSSAPAAESAPASRSSR